MGFLAHLASVVLLAVSAMQPGAAAPDHKLAGSEWTLAAFGEGQAPPLVEGSRVTLAFGENGRARGRGGCNSYGSSYEVRGRAISFSAIVSTKMACADEAATRQEQRYFQALEAARQFDLNGDRLILSDGGGRALLVFARA
jgi:putative lipoprotein